MGILQSNITTIYKLLRKDVTSTVKIKASQYGGYLLFTVLDTSEICLLKQTITSTTGAKAY